MDSIAAIIVTAFINIIVSSIVSSLIFYRYQKRIESAFAKSLLEYQTKFVRNYQKRVEALEILYNKYNGIMDYLLQSLNEMNGISDPPLSQLNEFRVCYLNNSLYFSRDEVRLLEDVYRNATNLSTLARMVNGVESHDSNMVGWINGQIGVTNWDQDLNIASIRINDPNKELFIDQLVEAIKNQAERLKKLYTTVVDTAKDS